MSEDNTHSWEWEYDDEGNLIKTIVTHPNDGTEWIDEQTKELKTEIPNSPFDGGKDWETEIDTDRGFDDEDEELTDEEIDELLNFSFEKLQWNESKKPFEELMKHGFPHTQRGFYCYVISQMSDEDLQPHIDNYVSWLERMNYKYEIDKLPQQVKDDEVVMDLRKRQIDDEGKKLGIQVVDDLMTLLRHKEEDDKT